MIKTFREFEMSHSSLTFFSIENKRLIISLKFLDINIMFQFYCNLWIQNLMEMTWQNILLMLNYCFRSNNILLKLIQQLTVNGPTTFCCHPLCVRPIFGCCSLVLTGFRPEPDPDFDENEPDLRPQSPFITSLFFCGPWCIEQLLTCKKELCLKLKLAILNCDISIRKVIQMKLSECIIKLH